MPKLEVIYEMCATVCGQCKTELESLGDVGIDYHQCGCYFHYRGLGGGEVTCEAKVIWESFDEAEMVIRKRKETGSLLEGKDE